MLAYARIKVQEKSWNQGEAKVKKTTFVRLSDDMMNSKIIRKTLVEEVADRIREDIRSSKLTVNHKLPTEVELSQHFGVGRSTVREAIRMLVHAGILRVQQGVGTFVEAVTGIHEPFLKRVKRADHKDLDEVRKLLEMKIAEKAARNRTEDDMEAMVAFLELRRVAADANDLPACVDADIHFHTSLAIASRNELLTELYQTLAAQLKKWFIEQMNSTDSFVKTQELHEKLLDCVKKKDSAGAWKQAEKIINFRD